MCHLAFPLGSSKEALRKLHISKEGIYFYVTTYSAASSLLNFTAALLSLLRHHSPVLQKDERLFNHAAAQLGSEGEVCLGIRWEAIGYPGQHCLMQVFHSPMCQAQTGPREVWHMLGRTLRTVALGERCGEDTGLQPCC